VLSLSSCVLAKRLPLMGLVGLWCCGCIAVQIHHAKKMRSGSTDTPPKQVDLTFIKVGETSHDEVSKRLSWIDAGVDAKAFFAGRWAENSWGVAWGAASFPYAGGGYNEIWKTHNVIIDFDDQSLVKGVTHFADKGIIAILSTRLNQASEPTLDRTVPIKMSIEYLPIESNKAHLGDLILGENELEFLESPDGNKKGKYSYKTAKQNISRITMGMSEPSEPQQNKDAGVQTAGREIRLFGIHVWSVLFAEDRPCLSWHRPFAEACEAHLRNAQRANRTGSDPAGPRDRRSEAQSAGTGRFPEPFLYQVLGLVCLTARTGRLPWATS